MSQYAAAAAGGEPSPASSSMTPTEALAKTNAEHDWFAHDDHLEDARDIEAGLAKRGFKIVPIASRCRQQCCATIEELEQAAEAADREAAGGEPSGERIVDPDRAIPSAAVAPLEPIPTDWGVGPLTHPAAVAPLDVEALREQVYYLLFIYGQMDAEHGHWAAVRRMLNIDAAYADAIRKRGER